MGAEYLPLIRSLMELDAPIRIFGGFAEDALLGGRIRRHHDDVDVMIARDALDRGLRMFEELAFAPPEIRFEPTAGSPLVMGTVREGLNLELSVIDIAEAGPPSFTLPGEHGLVRVLLPPDTWSWPPCELEGIVVRTISPLALYQIRSGLTVVGAMGPPRPKDIASQQALRERFFPDEPEGSLEPVIELL